MFCQNTFNEYFVSLEIGLSRKESTDNLYYMLLNNICHLKVIFMKSEIDQNFKKACRQIFIPTVGLKFSN